MFTTLVAVCLLAGTPQSQEQGLAERGWHWVQGAWKTVQKQGKPAAERVVREFPDRFKAIPKRASELHKRFNKSVADLKLEEKKAMIEELWRIRQGLNVMALLDSGLLAQLTGIDARTLKAAQQQVAALTSRLKQK
jgi:hypothetical protein